MDTAVTTIPYSGFKLKDRLYVVRRRGRCFAFSADVVISSLCNSVASLHTIRICPAMVANLPCNGSKRLLTISWLESNEGSSPEPEQQGFGPCFAVQSCEVQNDALTTYRARRTYVFAIWYSGCSQIETARLS
ncbi:hypothetical protein GJ496_011922 [Pomphorhynchus laevis]|nr:hypothetical protein GJ496_011922 [Pomphorhynchus laevis]